MGGYFYVTLLCDLLGTLYDKHHVARRAGDMGRNEVIVAASSFLEEASPLTHGKYQNADENVEKEANVAAPPLL